MSKIVYVGLKEQKADNVAGTGLVWARGQIHEVEDEEQVAKLLAHPLIWQDASKKYELIPEPSVVKPEPRVSFHPVDAKDAYWDPIIITIPAEVFTRLQKQELVATFMTPADADAFAGWKLEQENTAPKETGPAPQNKATKAGLESGGKGPKKAA